MSIRDDWRDQAWGSALLNRIPPEDATVQRVLGDIRGRARNIACSNPDRDVAELADAVLLLSAMLQPEKHGLD